MVKMPKIQCSICGKEFYKIDVDMCTSCFKEKYGFVLPVPGKYVGHDCCYLNQCPYPAYGNSKYCTFHHKTTHEGMVVYLTIEEQIFANEVWGRKNLAPWIGTRRIYHDRDGNRHEDLIPPKNNNGERRNGG